MPRRCLFTSTVTTVLLLSCMIDRSQAWIRREIESVSNNPDHAFKLRTSRRVKSHKSSKSSKYEKTSKGGDHYYGYHYHNAGFLDEDIATDFEDMFGNIVTADHFSYPHYHPRRSSKSGKSSKSDGYYMSYPIYDGKGQKGGKGIKNGKHEKLPYYNADYQIGSKSQKDTKLRPPKLTRPPSSPGPPGGPPCKYNEAVVANERNEIISCILLSIPHCSSTIQS